MVHPGRRLQPPKCDELQLGVINVLQAAASSHHFRRIASANRKLASIVQYSCKSASRAPTNRLDERSPAENRSVGLNEVGFMQKCGHRLQRSSQDPVGAGEMHVNVIPLDLYIVDQVEVDAYPESLSLDPDFPTSDLMEHIPTAGASRSRALAPSRNCLRNRCPSQDRSEKIAAPDQHPPKVSDEGDALRPLLGPGNGEATCQHDKGSGQRACGGHRKPSTPILPAP